MNTIPHLLSRHLDQVKYLLDILSPAQYSEPLPALHGNSAGKHVRHILEFLLCLEKALQTGVVNYDSRARDLRMEVDAAFSREVLVGIQRRFSLYPERFLELEQDYGSGPISIQTTFYRELVYNLEHSVHHLAILKVGLETRYPELELQAEMGVAWSTLQYQNAS
jgi:hypothetical protein